MLASVPFFFDGIRCIILRGIRLLIESSNDIKETERECYPSVDIAECTGWC